jgi:hypothetical protein
MPGLSDNGPDQLRAKHKQKGAVSAPFLFSLFFTIFINMSANLIGIKFSFVKQSDPPHEPKFFGSAQGGPFRFLL